ncbi:MAG: hypothetical protein HYR64_08795 [Fimbriimonas ginsengisoli]|uniref:Deoxycytidine triphosphate deaminase n=1 Tax=Fimbriimonas ginsengisoli TaxID=1005039 RepID=A0A931LVY1_FIMGI|nr:hypothetical protein [Fimbriimonas ginsengisoli]
MTLITKATYDAYYEPEKILRIENSDPNGFEHIKYYFRLGAIRIRDKIEPLTTEVTIPPGEYVQVFSLEIFTLSSRVMALLGQCTELFTQDLELSHGLSIDPGYPGMPLTLGIRNNASERRSLQRGMRIGKAIFFDVSESVVEMTSYWAGQLKIKESEVKLQAAEKVRRVADEI